MLSLRGQEMTSIPNQSTKLQFSWHLKNGLLGGILAFCGSFVVLSPVGLFFGRYDLIKEKLALPFMAAAAGLVAIFLAKRVAKRMLSLGAIQEPFSFSKPFYVKNILLVLVIGFLVMFTLIIVDYKLYLLYRQNLSSEMYLLVSLFIFYVIPLVAMETVASLRAEKHIKSNLVKGTNNK